MCFLKDYFTPEDEKFAITGGNVVNSQKFSQRKLQKKLYLERPYWPLGVPSDSQMRLWFLVFWYWLQIQLRLGSGKYKHTQIDILKTKPQVNSVYAVCWYVLYLFVGSVIVASMGSSFSSIQRCYPVWSLRQRHRKKLKHCCL